MSWEEAESRERQASLAIEEKRDEIAESGAAKIAASVQDLLAKIMADEDNQAAFWDDTPEGRKRYIATLLHEAAIKLGLTPEEVQEASMG